MNIEAVLQAQRRIADDIIKTPVITAPALREAPDVKLLLKAENFQITRSFKPRGAFNMLRSIENGEAVVTRSSGNFAQAVSYASSRLGMEATIVMPENAPGIKKQRTLEFGARVELCGATSVEGDSRAKEISDATGARLLSPYDHELIVAGQGTVALEVLDKCDAPDYFFAPIGGGGLMSGCAMVLKEKARACRVIGVEPAGADDYARSRELGERTALDAVSTIADGLRTACVGEVNWPILERCVDEVVRVTDDEIVAAMCWLYREVGVVIEPSGAAAVAAARRFDFGSGLRTAVCVLSGGNVDLQDFERLVSGGSAVVV